MPQSPRQKSAPLGRNGYRYRPQFGLVIVCRDEPHQAALYKQFIREGHAVRVVVV